MIDLSQIEKASIWELQSQLEFYQRDLNHAKSWLENIERDTSILKVALCLKINGAHKFERICIQTHPGPGVFRCKCGATCYAGIDMARKECNG